MDNSNSASALRTLKKYCVVVFLNGNIIDVVPRKWLFPSGSFHFFSSPEPDIYLCMWPSDDDEVQKMVKENQEPRDSWSMNRCRLLHTFKMYTRACAAIKQYQSGAEFDLDMVSTDSEESQNLFSVPIAEASNQAIDVRCSNCRVLENRIISLEQEVQSVKRILFEVKLSSQATLLSVQALVEQNTPVHLEGFSQLTTTKELTEFNQKLTDRDIFSKMILFFSAFGGKDAHAATRKIMSMLMSNPLAQQYNWIGSAKKKSFQEFKLVIRLVAASVRHVKSHAETNVTAIESWIARWLRYAADRDTAGKKRKLDVLE